MPKLSIFVPINKIDEEQRLVYGQVAAEVLDNSGEMFDYEGSKPYFEKWSDNAHVTSGGKSKGNLRVMHTSKVAGIVTDIGFNDDDRVIEACTKVIDDGEWAMVLAGGYTGFSMGGRYVSRATKADGVKTYIADPVEISLVDKPCIPTAVFSVVKADGLVEEHRFQENLYQKSDTGENRMYVPTNDEILPVARELAKAAGRTGENDWVDFAEAASEQLVLEKGTHRAGDGIVEVEVGDADTPKKASEKMKAANTTEAKSGVDNSVAAGDGTAVAPVVEQHKKADTPEDLEKAGNPFADKGKEDTKDAGKDESDMTDEEKAAKKKKLQDEEDAKKADIPDLRQRWVAKDDTLHLRKADAIAHNEALAKAAPVSIVDTLAGLVETAGRIAKGETFEAPALSATAKADYLAVTGDPLVKLQIFVEDPLVKGMYEVGRLVEIISSLDCLHSCVASEAAWEGDASTIPADVLAALKDLGSILVRMASEEVAEMVSEGNEAMGDDSPIMALAASTTGLEKSAFVSSLEPLRKAALAATVVDTPETLEKLAAAESKSADALAKADKLEADINAMEPLIKTLQEEMERIKAMPMGKAPTTTLGKGDDIDRVGNGASAAPTDLSKFTPDQLADAAIRLSHQHGQTVSAGR